MAEVVDHFPALGFERAAVLDESLVRERFHELSREVHPDAGGDGGDEEAFAAINEAQRVLRSPGARLRHLLELEFGEGQGAPAWEMSESLVALFAEVGGALSQADELIAKRRAATTAVSKALLAAEEMAAQGALVAAGGKLMARRREVEAALEGLGLAERAPLAAAAHELAFLEKWQRQVQERMGELV